MILHFFWKMRQQIPPINSSTEGKLFFESGASYATTSFDDKAISTDAYANNVGIETVADSILDFTEGNPFSEGTGY